MAVGPDVDCMKMQLPASGHASDANFVWAQTENGPARLGEGRASIKQGLRILILFARLTKHRQALFMLGP